MERPSLDFLGVHPDGAAGQTSICHECPLGARQGEAPAMAHPCDVSRETGDFQEPLTVGIFDVALQTFLEALNQTQTTLHGS
ncbi:MAG TPA: hypothetical protein VJ483_09380 [Holophagaceae bacterium]|nr:hypothetical protein [Holophagaceae bacterium]